MKEKEITRWTSKTTYVDASTGEIISKRTKAETKREVQQKYYIIKIERHVTLNQLETAGHIEYTVQCRRNPQGTLNFI